MKTKIHSLIIEGIVFCGSGLGLLSYSLFSYGKSFNKTWSQSPYLFPLIVSLGLLALSVCLIGEGLRESRKADQAADQAVKKTVDQAVKKAAPAPSGEKIRGVVVVMLICALYYAAMAVLKIPYITVGIFTFQFTFSTFEVVTLVFLGAMMAYMGVRKPAVLILVPVGTTLFLSIAFRTLLHVLLP